MLTLVHTGGIWKTRGLENIVAAIKDLKNVELIIAGRVMDIELQDQIQKAIKCQIQGYFDACEVFGFRSTSRCNPWII